MKANYRGEEGKRPVTTRLVQKEVEGNTSHGFKLQVKVMTKNTWYLVLNYI